MAAGSANGRDLYDLLVVSEEAAKQRFDYVIIGRVKRMPFCAAMRKVGDTGIAPQND